jgi:hypothetical protein
LPPRGKVDVLIRDVLHMAGGIMGLYTQTA